MSKEGTECNISTWPNFELLHFRFVGQSSDKSDDDTIDKETFASLFGGHFLKFCCNTKNKYNKPSKESLKILLQTRLPSEAIQVLYEMIPFLSFIFLYNNDEVKEISFSLNALLTISLIFWFKVLATVIIICFIL